MDADEHRWGQFLDEVPGIFHGYVFFTFPSPSPLPSPLGRGGNVVTVLNVEGSGLNPTL